MRVAAAYAAGLFDGEGTVVVKWGWPTGSSMICAVEITNAHRGVLERIQQTYGGRIYTLNRQPPGQRVHVHRLRLTGAALDGFAEDVLPHAVVKRSQLLLLKQARAMLKPYGGRHPRLTYEALKSRQEIIDRTRHAKAEGLVAW